MPIRKLVRFRLSTVFAIVTLCAVSLGYAKWKRKQFVNDRAALTREGIGVAFEDTNTGWLEYLATGHEKKQRATMAAFRVYQDSDGVRVGNFQSTRVGQDLVEERVARLVRRLDNFGVKDLQVIVFYEDEDWSNQAIAILTNYGFKSFEKRPQRVPIGEASFWMLNAAR